MDYMKLLDNYGSIIEDDLKSQLNKMARDGQKYHPFLGEVYDATTEFVLRSGRRLAACSTLIVYRGYRDQMDERMIKVCSAMELYRHSILIHDDIVDAEEKRRGGDTLHKTLGNGFDERFGVGSALFAGNILYAKSLESVLESGFDQKLLVEAAKLLASEFMAVNESQILDMLFEYKEPDTKEWDIMAGRRAASLFKASMLTGALLASASSKDLEQLESAAKHIGYAFDIQDDIIDTFASKEQYGRVPCGDIGKRKKPLHVIMALEKDKRLANIMAEERALSDADINQVQMLIRDCGALDRAKSISRMHARKAEKIISMTKMSDDAKDFFVSFIKYVDESLDWYK
jgi:geranylgeranyl diphosphate synthase, type I